MFIKSVITAVATSLSMDGKHFSNEEQNDHPLEKESNYMLKNVLHNRIAEKE